MPSNLPPAQGKSHTHSPIILGGVALVILAGLGTVWAMSHRNRETTPKEQQSTQNTSASPTPTANTTSSSADLFLAQSSHADDCPTKDVSFTSAPIPSSQLAFIEPMGKMTDGHVTPTDHVYVHPTNSHAPDNTFDAVMPADGTVVEISAMPAEYIGDRNQQAASDDHRLVIMHSCQYFSIFIHVHKLDPALSAVVGTMTPNTSQKVSIQLKAGDKVGKIGSAGFDWTLVDTKTTLTGFITPSLYDGESWKIHAIDPLSVYTGSMKTTLEGISLRSTAPLGGKIDWDKKGAAIGNWFREGTNGYSGDMSGTGRYWDGHLSIVPDYVDPASTIVSLGNWQGTAMQFVVKGAVDPSTVTATSGPVAYELLGLSYVQPSGATWTGNETFTKGVKPSQKSSSVGTVLFQVLDGEKLKFEKFVGKSASQVTTFTDAAQVYTR
jgi:hypothetical protein